ncbi:MAG TPA: YIP1 family protein [Candidatus Deferrimicrobium sp.]|nr:YIP1 family protein [Candidatus Deferrimicrobium sp.]
MEQNQIKTEIMKPQSENSGMAKIFQFFKDYFKIIRSPSKAIDNLNSREPNLLKAFLVVVLSSCIFVGGIFLYGDPISWLYNFYSTNFLIEQFTSFTSLGSFTFTTHTGLIFLENILFWIKIWIVLGILIYVWCKIFNIDISIERTLEMTAWSLFPWLAITFIFIPIMLLISLAFPAYAYVIYFPVVLAVIVVIGPCLFSTFIYKKYNISSFKSIFPYLFSLLILYAIWLYSNIELWFHVIAL